jgi:hypothetical protein
MARIRGKINLAKLKSTVMDLKGKSGNPVKCLIIPIEENYLFHSQQGAVYLDVICFESTSIPEYTHSIKQSLPKDIREKMTKEEQNSFPFLGNLELMTSAVNDGGVKSSELPEGVHAPELNDLPF